MNTAARTAPSPSKAGQTDAPRPLDTGAVTKRLQQELMSMMAGGTDGVSAFPAGDSLFDWVGTITASCGPARPPLPHCHRRCHNLSCLQTGLFRPTDRLVKITAGRRGYGV